MPNRPRLSYANVVSTLALFLVLGGGAAVAAAKICSADLAPGAVHTPDVYKRAITSGKLAVGAVRTNQIVDGAVGAKQIGDGVIGSKQIGTAAVAPSNLQFPVFYAASPTGGSAPVSASSVPYPVTPDSWTQSPGQIEVIFGAAKGTLAYDESSNQGACRVFFEVSLNGQQVGGGEIANNSTAPKSVEQTVGAQPQIDPVTTITNHLSVSTSSNGGCTAGSTIDSARFRALDFG